MRSPEHLIWTFITAILLLVGCVAQVPKDGFKVHGKLSEELLDELPANKIPIKYTIDYPKELTVSKCTGSASTGVLVELPLGTALKDAITEGLKNSFKISQDNYSYFVAIKIFPVFSTHEFSGGGAGMDQGSVSTKVSIQIFDSNEKPLDEQVQDLNEAMDISARKKFTHPAVIFDELTGKIAVRVVKSVSRSANRLMKQSDT